MTRLFPIALLVSLALAACSEPMPTERYGFLARLGQDTISVESVTRYRDRLISDEVDRFPQVRRRHTEIRLAEDGSPVHMDMRVHTPSADSQSRDRRIVADFSRDQVRVTLTDGSGSKSIEMENDGRLTLPHVPQMYSLYELHFSAALERAAADSLPPGGIVLTHQFYPDREFSNYPRPMHRGRVRPDSGGTVTITHDWLAGTGMAQLDSARRMLSYSGAGTTYKVDVTRLDQPPDIEALGDGFEAAEQARGPVAALSVRDTVQAQIGSASFTVDYSRPLVRGRTLLGDLIPYDYIWRTGANAATHFSISAPIRLGNLAVPAGAYTLWTLPKRDGITLIVNQQTGQWGTGYGPGHDLGRTPLTSEATASPVEQFTIAIEPRDSHSGVLALSWGPFRWTAPIRVE
jgi:hypothetical protein